MGNFLQPPLAKYIASQIHKKYDKNCDGMLSFDEFYDMSLRKDYKFHRLLFRYCKYVVPQKQSSIGKTATHISFFTIIFHFIRSFASLYTLEDATYDGSIRFWPPPLAMITFSIV